VAEMPIMAPRAMPNNEASSQPSSMRLMVSTLLPTRAPSDRPSFRLARVASGVGRNTLLTHSWWLASHHRAMMARNTSSDSATPATGMRVRAALMAAPHALRHASLQQQGQLIDHIAHDAYPEQPGQHQGGLHALLGDHDGIAHAMRVSHDRYGNRHHQRNGHPLAQRDE